MNHIDNLTFDYVGVDIDQGIHKGKIKVALNEKRKNYMGFLFP